ncbi:MAG: hypothetical protein M3Z09_00365 [Acidobacteriota bacterium]|nr:hypothetical protein [Acidobacteriota bacterium]
MKDGHPVPVAAAVSVGFSLEEPQ